MLSFIAGHLIFQILLLCIQGGDGFFNEILNGFLRSRHKATYPPTPPDFVHSAEYSGRVVVNDSSNTASTTSPNDEHSPLLSIPKDNGVRPGISC